jgi:hypothetical protein
MKDIQIPDFTSCEEEAEFWDNLDTGPYMEDDGEWFHFETDGQRALRVAILPEVASEIAQRARTQGVAVETLVNAWLIERLHETEQAT